MSSTRQNLHRLNLYPWHYLERAIRATTWNTPSLLTAIVRNWVEEGVVKQLEEKKRVDARMRQRLAKEILSPLNYISHPSSYFIWLPLNKGGSVRPCDYITY